MIISFIVAIPVIALAIWLYLKFCPANTTIKSRRKFEAFVLIAEILGCIGVSYYSYSTVGQGRDSAWWPYIAIIYCFLVIPFILILAAIIRKIVYRNAKSPNNKIDDISAPN